MADRFSDTDWQTIKAHLEASGDTYRLPERRDNSVVLMSWNIRKFDAFEEDGATKKSAGAFGHILPTGIEAVSKFAREHGSEEALEMPEIADSILGVMCHQLSGLNAWIDGLTKLLEQHAWLDADARRLMRLPGIGPITASAIIATIGDANQFETGRDLAAWLGLTPLNKSSGGREWLGRITEKGDRYTRKLLIVGMTSRALMARNKPEKADI